MSKPKLNIKEETSTKKTRSPPKKAKVEQSVPRKKKLKTDAEKTAEKAQHLRFGKAELTPDELSRLSKAQKREMYAAHAARSAVHREIDQYEDDNIGAHRRCARAKRRQEMSVIFPKAAMPGSSKRKPRCRARKAPKPLNLLHRSRLRHKMQAHPAPAREAPTGFHAGSNGKKSTKATMPPPGRARRRRPQAARRHPTVHLLPGPAWNKP